VIVYAGVQDARGAFVSGLTADDFEVMVNGERRSIDRFSADAGLLTVVVRFDISFSAMPGDLNGKPKLGC
jgi:hypothetical protein